jgi:hypothetical protein
LAGRLGRRGLCTVDGLVSHEPFGNSVVAGVVVVVTNNNYSEYQLPITPYGRSEGGRTKKVGYRYVTAVDVAGSMTSLK